MEDKSDKKVRQDFRFNPIHKLYKIYLRCREHRFFSGFLFKNSSYTYMYNDTNPKEVFFLYVFNSKVASTLYAYNIALHGSLAQLGERLPYKQDVGGSIPSTPTRKSNSTVDNLRCYCFFCA